MEMEILLPNVTPADIRTSRFDQMFPALTKSDMARIERFGTRRRYPGGTRLFAAGETGPGMFVILQGEVTISQRDALGHVVPIVRQGPGHFLAEVGQLSGRPALVDGYADRRCRSDPRAAGAVARADHRGSGPRRAHRSRADPAPRRAHRSGRGRADADRRGPDPRDFCGLQNFLRRNGQPHHVVDPAEEGDTAALLEQYGAGADDVLVVCPDSTVLLNPTEVALGRRLGMSDTARARRAVRRRRRRRRPGGPRHRGVCGLGGPCASSCSIAARSAARPAPARASRTTSAFRPESRGRRWPDARSCRRRSSARKS